MNTNLDFKWKNIPIQLKSIFIIGLSSFVITNIFYIFKFGFTLSDAQDKWGQFGDYLGGVLNPIFAFLSFSALLYTIILQRIEINKTLDELKTVQERNKIEDIVYVLKIISDETDNPIRTYIKNNSFPPAANNTSHSVIFELADRMKTIYKYLLKLESINNDSSVLDFYKIRYKGSIVFLFQKNYLTQDIYDFFTK